MRLIPTPRDALALAARGPAFVEALVTALPRTLALLDDAEVLLARVSTLVDQMDATRSAADEVVRRSNETVDAANAVVVRTAGTVASAQPTLERAERLVDGFAPPLERLRPLLERLSTTTDTHEVDALIGLIDHLPIILERVDSEVIPMLANLQTMAPDIHDMLALIQELSEMIGKLPGMGRIKQRADEQQLERAHDRARQREDSGGPLERRH